jgi:hypothetical protein
MFSIRAPVPGTKTDTCRVEASIRPGSPRCRGRVRQLLVEQPLVVGDALRTALEQGGVALHVDDEGRPAARDVAAVRLLPARVALGPQDERGVPGTLGVELHRDAQPIRGDPGVERRAVEVADDPGVEDGEPRHLLRRQRGEERAHRGQARLRGRPVPGGKGREQPSLGGGRVE